MKQATNKTTITTLNKGIATILFLSQLLTSCSGEAGAIAPDVIPQESAIEESLPPLHQGQ